jgi:hypothetical protein
MECVRGCVYLLRLPLSEIQYQNDMVYEMRGGALSVGLLKTN